MTQLVIPSGCLPHSRNWYKNIPKKKGSSLALLERALWELDQGNVNCTLQKAKGDIEDILGIKAAERFLKENQFGDIEIGKTNIWWFTADVIYLETKNPRDVGILSTFTGFWSSPALARLDYVRNISGKLLIYRAYSSERREVDCPDFGNWRK